MTDIVDRLRKAAKEPCDGCCYGETMEQAADEIERLRAQSASRRGGTMTDIVERLKPLAREIRNGYAIPYTRCGMVDEAAAEIERLRALKTPASARLLNITKAALDSAEAEVERLRAEVKRLQITLKRVATCNNDARVQDLREDAIMTLGPYS